MNGDIVDKVHRTAPALHCGEPSPGFQDWAITHVYFHGYEDIPLAPAPSDAIAVGDGDVFSPSFYCLGQEWRLGLSKGEDDAYIYLSLLSSTIIHLEYCISLRHFSKPDKGSRVVRKIFDYGDDCIQGNCFINRMVSEYLTNGGLMCEVRMVPVASHHGYLFQITRLRVKQFNKC